MRRRSRCASGSCSRSGCLRLGVAIEEALLNAYYHGNLEISSKLREEDHRLYHEAAEARVRQAPYRDRKIYVSVKITPTQAIYCIRDEGPGFDPASLPDPTDPANLDRPCGRGMLLMRTFMDNVIYNDRGNEVTLFKQRDGGDEGEGKEIKPGSRLRSLRLLRQRTRRVEILDVVGAETIR